MGESSQVDELIEQGVALALAADDMKGEAIRLLDVRGRCAYTDMLLFVSARSVRQVRSIADALERRGHELNLKTVGKEGGEQGNWVLVDLGEVLVHVFYAPARMYYDLEALWEGAPEVPLPIESDPYL